MSRKRERSWVGGVATLLMGLWLAGVWIAEGLAIQVNTGVLAIAFVAGIGLVYCLGRIRSRTAGVLLVLCVLAVIAFWTWSPAAGLAAAVLVLVLGMDTLRPAFSSPARVVAALLLVAEGAVLATITLLTASLFAIPVRIWWVGAAWLTVGLALVAASLCARTRGERWPVHWRLVGAAGLAFCAQVGLHAYGAWGPWPPGPPAWIVPLSSVLALLAMLALAAAEVQNSARPQVQTT